MLGKFLDPKNDFAFKSIFGTEKHKGILIHFINDMLGFEGKNAVGEVKFLKTTQDPEIASKKQSLIDVLCTDGLGRQYIIEMQVAKTAGFEKRAQYYAAKAYGQQLQKGEDYTTLKEIIFIAITDFLMFPDKPNYYSTHCLLDKITYDHDLKDFSFSFLELPKFNKTIDELSNMIEKWAYFFKYAENTCDEDLAKLVGDDAIILEAYKALDRFHWSEIELNTYEQEEKRERDARSILNQAIGEARAEGEAGGIEKERARLADKWRAKGMSEKEIQELL
jgi:predicted transposase/invertase (TIGR01784 family)